MLWRRFRRRDDYLMMLRPSLSRVMHRRRHRPGMRRHSQIFRDRLQRLAFVITKNIALVLFAGALVVVIIFGG